MIAENMLNAGTSEIRLDISELSVQC